MSRSITTKLEGLRERLEDLQAMLADPDVLADQNRYRGLAREHSELTPVVHRFNEYHATLTRIDEANALLEEGDAELKALAQEDLEQGQGERERLERELRRLLIPPDPADASNIFLEVRAGTGGDEAALFAGDLFRMYTRYAERQRWSVELVSQSLGEQGGYKEVVVRLVGRGVYSRLKFESGGHRVQRVPVTESQGRIHTSACTVAVLPEAEAIEDVEINPKDLRIDTFRASGAGGQHVNKTDSAIRITHLPSGTVIECQDERSQHKNKARAMSLLKARLLAAERDRQNAERAETRRLLVGSGDRSQRIRTYNFPQGRITDHRIGLTLYKLEMVVDGGLDQIIDPLVAEFQAEQLAALETDNR